MPILELFQYVQRLDSELAATVMQLYLWAPSSWLKSEGQLPSSNEVIYTIYYKIYKYNIIN